MKLEGYERLLIDQKLTKPGLEEACDVQRRDAVVVSVDVERLRRLNLGPEGFLAGSRAGLSKQALGVQVTLEKVDDGRPGNVSIRLYRACLFEWSLHRSSLPNMSLERDRLANISGYTTMWQSP